MKVNIHPNGPKHGITIDHTTDFSKCRLTRTLLRMELPAIEAIWKQAIQDGNENLASTALMAWVAIEGLGPT